MKTKILLSLVIIIFCVSYTNAQWKQCSGTFGGQSLNCILTKDSTIIASMTTGGIFLSADNGFTWTMDTTGIRNTPVTSLVANDSDFFASTLSEGIFISQDHGLSWVQVNAGLPNDSITSLAIIGTKIFAGTISYGVFFSDNNGVNWYPDSSGLANASVSALAVSDTNLFAIATGGVYFSSMNGTTWTPATGDFNNASGLPFQAPPVRITSVLGVSNSGLFVSGFGFAWGGNNFNGLFASHNSGANWAFVLGYPVNSIACKGNEVYAGTLGGIYYSNDNGTSFNPVNTGLPGTVSVTALSIKNSTVYAGTADGNIFKTIDNGMHWSAITQIGVPVTATIESIAVNGNDVYASSSDVGLFVSADNGTNWKTSSNGLPGLGNNLSLAANANYVYAGGYGMYTSDDKGNFWIGCTTGYQTNDFYGVTLDGNNVYASLAGYGVIVSNDNGNNWSLDTAGMNGFNVIHSIAVSGNKIFAANNSGIPGLYISNDGGLHWTTDTEGLENNSVTVVLANGNSIFAGTTSGLFRSTNGGIHWAMDDTAGLGNNWVYSMANMGNTIFAGTFNGVYVSFDNGDNWQEGGLPLTFVKTLALNNTDIFAGLSGGGIWKRSLSDFVSLGVDERINNNIGFNIYPNPTENNFSISLYKDLKNARMEIFNTLAKKVYSESFNGNQKTIINKLDKGIYFVRVSDGKESFVRKIVVR